MWRAFFMGIGVFALVFGAECLVTDRFILATEVKPPANQLAFISQPKKKEFVPPEWAPYTFLSLGTISILYSLTLPKLGGAGGGDPGPGH
jgi:hypothetical protein